MENPKEVMGESNYYYNYKKKVSASQEMQEKLPLQVRWNESGLYKRSVSWISLIKFKNWIKILVGPFSLLSFDPAPSVKGIIIWGYFSLLGGYKQTLMPFPVSSSPVVKLQSNAALVDDWVRRKEEREKIQT